MSQKTEQQPQPQLQPPRISGDTHKDSDKRRLRRLPTGVFATHYDQYPQMHLPIKPCPTTGAERKSKGTKL